MKSVMLSVVGAAILGSSMVAAAQSSVGRSFTAASQDVLERDGIAYVKFEGELSRNDAGPDIEVRVPAADLKPSDELTLPAAATELWIGAFGALLVSVAALLNMRRLVRYF